MPSVLVASPDAALRENAQELFESRGYTVAQATSERELRTLMERTPPDLIVLDPQIRGVFGTIPVVLLTDQIRDLFAGRRNEA